METKVKKVGGKWTPQFKIGNQTFSLQPCEIKADADWFVVMLDKAFLKLNKSNVSGQLPLSEVHDLLVWVNEKTAYQGKEKDLWTMYENYRKHLNFEQLLEEWRKR